MKPALPFLRHWVARAYLVAMTSLGLLALVLILGEPAPPGPSLSIGYAQRGDFSTPTPFHPLGPTPTALPSPSPSPTTEPSPQAPPPLTEVWHGADFSEGNRVQIVLRPEGALDPGLDRVRIAFRTGRPCEYTHFRACVALHPGDAAHAGVLLATVHSGLGGDGQSLRHALEGTGLNTAAFGLDEIARRMEALAGACATVLQGQGEGETARVVAVLRVPPDRISEYFTLAPYEALERFGGEIPALRRALDRPGALLVIETCGWRHPAEWGLPGASDTTGSIYLLVLR
jgi:hypothetical protein